MKILNTNSVTNVLKFIPRHIDLTNVTVFTSVTITEEGSNATETLDNEALTLGAIAIDGDYLTVECDFTILKVNNTYNIEIKQYSDDQTFNPVDRTWYDVDSGTNEAIIHRCKATAIAGLVSDDYSINDGEFTIDEDEDNRIIRIYD